MYQLTPDEAKERLADLIAAALRGEKVIIGRDGEDAVQLIPLPATRHARRAGSARGLMTIRDDFDAPLPEFEDYSR